MQHVLGDFTFEGQQHFMALHGAVKFKDVEVRIHRNQVVGAHRCAFAGKEAAVSMVFL